MYKAIKIDFEFRNENDSLRFTTYDRSDNGFLLSTLLSAKFCPKASIDVCIYETFCTSDENDLPEMDNIEASLLSFKKMAVGTGERYSTIAILL